MKNRTDTNLVYSTDSNQKGQKKSAPNKASALPDKGPCKIRLETKGRRGKTVTVLFNLPFTEAEAKMLMRELQGQMACGATFKNNQIEFRGDLRDAIETALVKKQIKVLRAGG